MAAKHSLVHKDKEALTGVCSVCGSTKIARNGKYGFVCVVARREAQRRFRSANPEKVKQQRNAARVDWRSKQDQMRFRFGMNFDDYEAMLAAQDGGCAICKRPPREGERRFAIDHDHSCCPGGYGRTCGKCVRGLLCHRCNLGLGYLEGWYAEHGPAALRYLGLEAEDAID